MKNQPLDDLAVFGALTMNYMNTTHGNDFGHDHHCSCSTPANEDPTQKDIEECTCGWATFYTKYLELDRRSA